MISLEGVLFSMTISIVVGEFGWVVGLVLAWRLHVRHQNPTTKFLMLTFGFVILCGVLSSVLSSYAFYAVNSGNMDVNRTEVLASTIQFGLRLVKGGLFVA